MDKNGLCSIVTVYVNLVLTPCRWLLWCLWGLICP